ncbi:MAG: AsmA family protein [Emcibacter sp.]|nr:AsmA family protein [Emcibacter sp.]
MKKLGLGLGILIVILIGAILVVPSFLNWNEYKDQIEQTASEYSGRDVRIKGDISLTLLPTSALSVKDVTVTNLDGGRAEYMLSLKSLDVKVSFPSVISSLFGGKIKVEKFILVDPVVALEILADGRVNWDMGGSPSDGSTPTTTSADISLDKFQIVNGQISFENMTTRQMELLRKINANVKVKSINGPFEVSGSAKYKELDAQMSFSLGKSRPGKKVPVNIVMTMLNEQVTAKLLGGVILSGKDSVFSGKLDVKAQDAGDIFTAIDRFKGRTPQSATKPVLKVGQDFAFDTVVEVTSEKVLVKDVNIRMGQSRGQGNAQVSLGETVNILAALSVNKLDMDPLLTAFAQQKNAQPLIGGNDSGNGTGQGSEQDLLSHLSGKLDLKLGALKYNGKLASQISLKLLVKDSIVEISTIQARMPGGSALTFKGQITQMPVADPKEDSAGKENQQAGQVMLTGDMSLNASNLRGLLNWLKVDVAQVPSGKLAQFSYKSSLKVTPDLMQLYGMNGKLDAMTFKGGVSYAFGGRPSYGISLDFRNLNLDSYLAKDTTKSKSKIDFSKSLAILDEFDASYKLALSNVTVGGVKIHSGQLEGLLLGGALSAKKIQVTDAAGINLTASGSGKNFSSKPEFSLNLSAEAKSLSTLQRLLKLEGDFDLRTLGPTKVKGRISSTFAKMEVNLKSTIGGNKLDVKGTIRSATLKKFPEIGSVDLEVDGKSTSLAALIDQLNLPMTKPRPGDDRPVRVRGRVKASSDLIDIDGALNIAAGEILIKGRSKGKGKMASLDLTLDLKGKETREFIRGLGIDFQPSAGKLGLIALKMKVIGTGDQYAFSNIVGDVGPVKLSGTGKLNMGRKIPYFDFNLKAGAIPLHDFLKAGDKKLSQKNRKKNKAIYGQWTKQAMDLSLLSAYEGRARISAASLQFNNYLFDKPTFETILKDGILSVNNFTGRLFGGDVLLSGRFGGVPNADMSLNVTLKKASLSQAAKSSAGVAPVTGFFDLSGKFTGRGKSQFDMISSLSGEGKIIASPGLISGIDIPALSSQLTEMDTNNDFLKLLGTTLSGGETPYKGGVSNITVKNGKVGFSPFDIELDGAKSKVKMAVDLLNWTIRSDGRLSLVDHPNAPPIGVSIRGDVSNPSIIYKTDRLKKYVGAKIASKMLQKLVGGEGGLEGLFGGQPKKNAPVPMAPATNETGQVAPKEKLKPVEEFGKRLLQKLFEKKSDPKSTSSP